ncbi:MAG TPA: hypothetical protein PL181_00055 [bacterium]|nr:hypothetical protein [bacterium]
MRELSLSDTLTQGNTSRVLHHLIPAAESLHSPGDPYPVNPCYYESLPCLLLPGADAAPLRNHICIHSATSFATVVPARRHPNPAHRCAGVHFYLIGSAFFTILYEIFFSFTH